MGSPLAELFSRIDSAKRVGSDFVGGLLSNPLDEVQAMYRNRENAARDNLDMLGNLYKDNRGKVTLDKSKWSPKSANSHQALVDQATGAMMGATVYHGSPHTFNKFDSRKIGTGEGNQAYGNGLYLAQKPDVAKSYMNLQPAGGIDMNAPGAALGRAAFDIGKGDVKSALAFLEQKEATTRAAAQFMSDGGAAELAHIAAARARLASGEYKPGNLYKVDLPDEKIAAMADWDKSLGKQPAAVQAALQRSRAMLPANARDDLGGDLSLLYKSSNGLDDFIGTANSLQPNLGETLLQKLGVPGVQFLDQGSRATGVRNKSRNFVVFPGEEGSLSILSRNGKPVADGGW